MAASHSFVLWRILWTLLASLLFACQFAHAAAGSNNATTPAVPGLVAAAQTAMAHANALILNHPRLNHYETQSAQDKEAASKEAEPLSLSGFSNSTASSGNGARVARRASASNATVPSGQEARSYTVPPEVAEAAVDASSGAASIAGQGDDYDSVVAGLQAKFQPKINDTNRMAQRTQTYSGLMAGIIPAGHGYELATTDAVDNSSTVQRRQQSDNTTTSPQSGDGVGDSTAFWMETIKHLGAVAGGPNDYKVWRNVKDYGAMGDGVTDDTAAIQKAMTDGGRGTEDSGVLPATVYFPSGTYLISSPIIHLAYTEIIGNPLSLPRLVAAPSFVGLGLLTSEAFARQGSAWFLDSASQQRSARNLVIDIRAAPEDAYVAGVHWQAGRGCSLENVRFYMSQAADTTQLGLFVENGRGGSLSDLFFVGGRAGMLVGQQQFAADGLYFSNCQTAVQMVWDWGLSLQNLVVSNCDTGVDIVEAFNVSVPSVPDNGSNNSSSSSNGTVVRREGAHSVKRVTEKSSSWWPYGLHKRQNNTSTSTDDGGPSSLSRAGSFSLVDLRFADTKVAIAASLSSESTALLVLNAAFSNVGTSIRNSDSGADLVAGGSSSIEAWAFGKVYDRSSSSFKTVQGDMLSEGAMAPPQRNTSLTISSTTAGMPQPIFFHRRRPSYASIDTRSTQIINVKDFGARGDGASDDTGILNKVLDMAANMSAVVYFPHGSYVISDTINVPIGSRLVGEAWATIVATSEAAFGDAENPRAAVRVGRRVPGLRGDAGVIEIQGLTFTTRGKADGAVVMEWNAHQPLGSQGSAGLWDTQFRVGDGKEAGSAALMLHLRRGSSAYIDNIGLGPDTDASGAASGRGLLVESRGPTWLWGTSSGNNAVHQYGFYRAENIVAGQLIMSTSTASSSLSGMAQDLVNKAPFAADPLPDSKAALTSVRISNSDSIQVLSAGDLDSASSVSMLDIEHSSRVSVHNANGVAGGANNSAILASASVGSDTDATIEPPVKRRQAGNSTASPDSSSDDGKTASILSMTDASTTAAAFTWDPFALWTLEDLDGSNTTDACNAVLTSTISCPNITLAWSSQPSYHGSLGDANLTAAVCDDSCLTSLSGWIVRARRACTSFVFPSGMSPLLPAYYILNGLSETCSTDSTTGENCNDVIDRFDGGSTLDDMPKSELCSDCYVSRLRLMQGSAYSIYRLVTYYQRALKKAITTCPLDPNTPTDPQPAPIPSDPAAILCISGKHYTSKAGDDCNSIALASSVSSANLLNSNKNVPSIINCTSIPVGTDLCLPLECKTYSLQANETCSQVAFDNGITADDLLRYNSWIDPTCSNLDAAAPIVGRVLCLSPAGGLFDPGNGTSPGNSNGNGGTGQNSGGTGYSDTLVAPPEGIPVAKGTTLNCGVWRAVRPSDTCNALQLSQGLARELLLETNPSLVGSDCDAQLQPGMLYCLSPLETWDTVVSYPYNKLGCYAQSTVTADNTTTRVLWDEYMVDAGGMTVEQCADHCLLMGFPFFGLLDGDACYCGNTLTAGSSSVAAAKCDQKCVGNTTETCGGSDASNTMNVWGWPSAVVIASAS
ncbi:pectin lyase-like protein [Thozetella sp. PMI_491]|nr:pectin lyase-like protein [Thozetella sp. PMI_491]